MSKITRKEQLIFGGNLVAAGNIAKFGSLRISAPGYSLDPDAIQTAEYLNGWAGALSSNKAPAMQDMNALEFLVTRQLAYLMQAGVPEWCVTTPYFIGSTVATATGKLYTAIADNTGIAVTDRTKWKPHGPSLPLGSVIATFPDLTGAYVCTATTAPDDEGFVLCGGQTLMDGPMTGAVVPNINNDVFLMGNVASGAAAGANTKTMPSHTHSLSVSGTQTQSVPAHEHLLNNNGGAKIWIDPAGGMYQNPDGPSTADVMTEVYSGSPRVSTGLYTRSIVGLRGKSGGLNAATNITVAFTSTGTSDVPTTATLDIRPSYITAVYLMRVG